MSDRANLPGRGSEIAVVGMALKVPGAQNVDGFWRNLADGVESITPQDDEALKAAGEDPAELLIDVEYSVRGTNSRANWVYPFYLREASIPDAAP